MYLQLAVCVVLMTSPVLTRLQMETKTKEHGIRERQKRSIILFRIAALIKTAKAVRKGGNNVELFKKHGGYKLAEKDFDSLKPTNIKDFGYAKSGKVGDTDVVFMTVNRLPRIIIQEPKLDGTSARLTKEIIYIDRLQWMP